MLWDEAKDERFILFLKGLECLSNMISYSIDKSFTQLFIK